MRSIGNILSTLGALSFLSLAVVLFAGILGAVSGILSTAEAGNLWAFGLNNIPAFGAAELIGVCLFIMGRMIARLAD